MPVKLKLEYSIYTQNPMKSIGVTGYSGTLNGLFTCGIFFRRTKRLIPVKRKKNQKTGAVKSTIDSNPLRVNAPNITRATAMMHCKISEFTGADLSPFHLPKNEKALKSLPSA